tara:strand:- start:939 stop:3359 length:2421 start_codon:yes stop_codon:yes gene_type:complete
MGENVKSGHTQSLTDGDYILSPSITNLFEATHGNGILMYEDTATGDSNRNAKATTPGLVTDNGTNSIVVRGGYAVLDGMIVPFADIGSGATTTITLQQSTIEGSTSALTSGQSCLLVVYVCSNANNNYIQIEQGSAVSSGFPVTPESFLGDTSGLNGGLTLSSKQSTVLAVVKCQYNAGAGDLNLEVTEVYDVRTFIRPSPVYLSPVTTGSVGNQSNRVNSAAGLDGMHGGGDEAGGFASSNFGAIWQSYSYGTDGTDGDHVVYYSGKQGGARRTHRLGPNKISVLNTAQTVRFDGPNIFNATPASGDINITPSGTFPPSHMIIVNNAQSNTHKVIFDPSGLSNGGATAGDVGPSSSAIFVYTGSAWVKVFASSTSTTSASGSAGAIQLSDGSSSFTNDTDLSFTTASNTLNVGGPITMAGLLTDASGIAFKDSVSTNPAGSGPDARTLWVDSDDGKLYFNTAEVQMANANAQFSLNDLSAAAIDVSADSFGFIDASDSNNSKKESIADLATAMAGTGISASSGVLNLDANQAGITSIGPAGNLTVNQDLIVTGTLTVNGATTTVNSTTLTIDDKLIELAHSPSGSEGNDAAVDGGGIILKSSDSDKSIVFTDSTDSWTFNQHLFPSSDSSKNFGSDTVRWATGYLDTVISTDLTIDTNLLKTDSTNNRVGINQASPDADFQVKELGFGYGSANTGSSSTSTALTVDLFHDRKFKAAKLLVSVENSTDSIYETAEMVVTHNGTDSADSTTAFLNTYGVVTSDTTQQGTYQIGVSGSSGSKNIQLQVTPTVDSKNVTVRVSWQALTI